VKLHRDDPRVSCISGYKPEKHVGVCCLVDKAHSSVLGVSEPDILVVIPEELLDKDDLACHLSLEGVIHYTL
jgi:hypothetical protein